MNAAPAASSRAGGWREFLDLLGDAVMVFDAQDRVAFVNTAALRLLPAVAGLTLDQLTPTLGDGAVRWLALACQGRAGVDAPPLAVLNDGRHAEIAWRTLDAEHSALRLAVVVPSSARDLPHVATASTAPPWPAVLGAKGLVETLRICWEWPFPAMLQDEAFRIVDVNEAFIAFTGFARARLVGTDPISLYPRSEWAQTMARRERLRASDGRSLEPVLMDGRLLDAAGRELRFRLARRTLIGPQGELRYLAVFQDATAKHVASERAERSLRELDDWFALSPVGMVLFDDAGLLLRTNVMFDAIVGDVPASLADAPLALRELLAWGDGLAGLPADAASVQRTRPFTTPQGAVRALRCTVRRYVTANGQERYMAVLEDRSAEEERDLAQFQIGTLMDAAGVGLATFHGATDRARPGHADSRGAVPDATGGVDERAGGQGRASVVTLDITEQHRAQQRSEQLLHELSTILESTTAGIAYLRGAALVRCNRRFEAMLGLPADMAQGTNVAPLFGRYALARRIAVDALQSLTEGVIYETEFELESGALGPGSAPRWYALSVRRVGPVSDAMEAIAVLSDVTRLKAQAQELEALARDRELMFSLSGVGIAFVRGGRIERANQALAHLAGCTPAELAAMPLSALFPAGQFETRWAQAEKALLAHGRWTGERPLRLSDGRQLWVQVSKQLVTRGDLSGGVIASYVNVDARHRAESAVAMQAERTRVILDSVLVGIVTVGPQGIEWMNRSARRMFAGNLADFLNLPIATVATPEPEHPFRRTEYLTELVEGQAETFECRVMARDGREFWVVGNVVSTARESTGRQLTYALLDIERRRQAEARMSQAQASLQRIIEAAPLAIALFDARTLKVLQINGVAAGTTGASRDELVGRAPEEIFPPDVAAVRRRDMAQSLAATEVSQRDYRTVQAGEPHFWDARYLPLASVPGAPPDQLLLVATDVTEQRAAQEARLEAAIEQRDMLVKEVHHRIKNNLQGVAGLLDQIARRKPEVAGAIAEVVGQVHAIAHVYGLQVDATGPLPVVNVVSAITASVQRTFGRPIRVEVEGPSPQSWRLPEAESIPIALTLNELLTNAVKHSAHAPGADLVCRLTSSACGVVVSITNAGMLPAGFNLGQIRGSVSGLGLVRALLPRRHASLRVEQHGDTVLTTVVLQMPGVVRNTDGLA